MTRSLAILLIIAAAPAMAQDRSVRQTATTYGARLNAKGLPANLNANRLNNRIDSRLDTRLSLRIERFRVGNDLAPTAAFNVKQDDRSRAAPVVAPPPPPEQD